MLSKWFRTCSSGSHQRNGFVRPQLETLEDRLTPSSGFVGSFNATPALTPSENGAAGSVLGINAMTGNPTGSSAFFIQMDEQIALAVDNFLLSLPAVQANPSLSSALNTEANQLNSALHSNLASQATGQAGATYNMTLTALATAQARPM